MNLIKREPSPAQSEASRANGRLSSGPRTERGKEVSSRNLPKLRPFAEVVARSLQALDESPQEFEQMHQALAAAMAPRDAWEAAWVQDIAVLRWRLEHLQRAEAGVMAMRRRRLIAERRRATLPQGGSADLQLRAGLGIVGFTGIPDSRLKFEKVLEFLTTLQHCLKAGMFEEALPYFSVLYGNDPGFRGAWLRRRFEDLAAMRKEGHADDGIQEQCKSVFAELEKDIEDYTELQALYEAEHAESDPVPLDAELLLPSQELDAVIRYETHLEDQIERKLRQFYARRREASIIPNDAPPQAPEAGKEPGTNEPESSDTEIDEPEAANPGTEHPVASEARAVELDSQPGNGVTHSARSCAKSARTGAKSVATLCQNKRETPKPEKLLKTKMRRLQFSAPEPENVLKTNELKQITGSQKCGDNLTGSPTRRHTPTVFNQGLNAWRAGAAFDRHWVRRRAPSRVCKVPRRRRCSYR